MQSKVVTTQAEYEAALARMAELMDAQPGSPEEQELELLTLLVEQYEQRHLPIAPSDLVEVTLFRIENAYLQPTTSSEANNDEGSFEPAVGWRRAKLHSEAEAWRSLPPAVQRSYGDDFVAVHNGQVVDHDGDRLTLYRRIRTRFGDVPVLITPASAPSPRVFQMHSPRLERTQ